MKTQTEIRQEAWRALFDSDNGATIVVMTIAATWSGYLMFKHVVAPTALWLWNLLVP